MHLDEKEPILKKIERGGSNNKKEDDCDDYLSITFKEDQNTETDTSLLTEPVSNSSGLPIVERRKTCVTAPQQAVMHCGV